MGTVSYAKEIPVRYETDVFVAGGGPAGVTAAVAAARNGCKVLLAESQACLGGMGTSGLIPAFMTFTDGENFLAGGLGREIYDKSSKLGGYGIGIRTEVLKKIYDDMLLDAGVDFLLCTSLIDVVKKDGNVEMAVLSAKSGIFAVKAKIFIDGTGDGDLAVMAGAEYEKGNENGDMMAATLCSIWSGVDWSRVDTGLQEKNLEKAFADNVFTTEDRHLPGMWRVGDKLGGGNIGHAFNLDGTDEVSITKALIEQRKKLEEYERYYKGYLPGFENIELVTTAALLGIRETRRIIGDYVLNLDDFMSKAIFEDEIGRYCYPVDIHASSSSKENYEEYAKKFKEIRYKKGENYGVPYRILTPKGFDNLLVAGRCVSTDRYLQSSIRVMPGCFITGQAAGCAAALAIKSGGTRSFEIKELQSKLKSMGGYLPNAE